MFLSGEFHPVQATIAIMMDLTGMAIRPVILKATNITIATIE